jgi:type IV pilus assembly protein PilO
MAKINIKPSNKLQIWILCGLGLAIVLAVFVFTMKPMCEKLKKLEADIQIERKNLEEAKELISKREMYEKWITAIKENIKYYEGKLPNAKETDKLLEDLARIAIDTKIKYRLIKPGAMTSLQSEKIELPYYRWPISMRLSCGYHELGLYINQLETATRFIKVDDIAIDAEDDVLQHRVTLNLSTYVVGK